MLSMCTTYLLMKDISAFSHLIINASTRARLQVRKARMWPCTKRTFCKYRLTKMGENPNTEHFEQATRKFVMRIAEALRFHHRASLVQKGFVCSKSFRKRNCNLASFIHIRLWKRTGGRGQKGTKRDRR